MPSALAGKWIISKKWEVDRDRVASSKEGEDEPKLDPLQITTLFFLAIMVMALSNWIKAEWIDRIFPSVPSILIVTTFALILAQFGPVRRLKGAWEIGDLAFYLFFAAVGALINFYQAIVLSPVLFLYVMIIMLVHFSFLFGVGALLKMDLAVLTIASVATKGGPAVVLSCCRNEGMAPPGPTGHYYSNAWLRCRELHRIRSGSGDADCTWWLVHYYSFPRV